MTLIEILTNNSVKCKAKANGGGGWRSFNKSSILKTNNRAQIY